MSEMTGRIRCRIAKTESRQCDLCDGHDGPHTYPWTELREQPIPVAPEVREAFDNLLMGTGIRGTSEYERDLATIARALGIEWKP